MLKNPLNVEDMKYEVDICDFPEDDTIWTQIDLTELERHRQHLNIPVLDIDMVTAFNNIALGNYR